MYIERDNVDMLSVNDFKAVVKEKESFFESIGIEKHKNTFIYKVFKLSFVFSRPAYLEEYGLGFFIRLENTAAKKDMYGNLLEPFKANNEIDFNARVATSLKDFKLKLRDVYQEPRDLNIQGVYFSAWNQDELSRLIQLVIRACTEYLDKKSLEE
jgi:hypothetical protein